MTRLGQILLFVNLGLSLMDKIGLNFERLGDSTGRVSDL